MDWLRFVLCTVLLKVGETGNATGNYVFTYQMAAECKEHICRHGYKYETFYRIDAEDRQHVITNASMALDMHIAILAANNGHILLSTQPHPTSLDPVYEIVVGGGGNKFTELRRNLRRNGKISKPTVGILSSIEFRAFFIRITTDGAVQFGKEGEDPLLDYRDNNPLAIRYFSFASWNGVEAKFCYDCPPKGTNMAAECKEHICRHGYKYETFYRIDAEDRQHVITNASMALDMHIAILAANNGHILLSTQPHPTSLDPVYEIVVGGGGNKFTELRRNLRRNGKISKPTVGILSSIEFRAFFIRITTDGAVQFGKEGEDPLLDYRDNNPLAIRYFSFASWNGVEAKFCYDCPPKGTNMAAECKEHICRHGYKYETFYRIDAEDRQHVITNASMALDMHIAILAANNGHILLSTQPHPTSLDPVYEIVVGGGGNKFTELRRNLRRNGKISKPTVGILSSIEFRAFFIRITTDGAVQFGKEGEDPLLDYRDNNPLAIRYFSFASWNGVEAKFCYDCPPKGTNMAAQCKEHICRHGYKYETFYRIDAEDRQHVITNASMALDMHIAILAANNGHILLSTQPHPTSLDPVYEIVVGGGGNKFTELRRNLRRNGKISKPTVGILSSIEFRAFFIRITTDGAVQFGKEGEDPLLDYRDNNPLAIRYFSFASWNGVEAKFCYDCPPKGTNSSTTNSEAVDPLMSSSDKLKTTLLQDRAPHLPPTSPVNLRLGLKVTSVKYSPFTSKMVTGIAVVMSWVDDSMAWNPDKFSNISRLTFSDGQIWRPTLFLFNSEDQGAVDIDNPGPVTMVNSGEATYYFQTHLTSWCYNYAKTTNNWPHDDYNCVIVLGPWEPHEKITIEQIKHVDEKMAVFADSSQVIPNEWSIEWKQGVVEPSAWHSIFTANDNDTNQSDRFLVSISLNRRAKAFNIVFYTPLLVLVLFVLMSFWSEPLHMARVWFYAGSTMVICVALCYVDYLVPIHTVPSILVLYVTVMGGVLLALVLQVLLMTATAERLCRTHTVQRLLRSRVVRICFCLPPVKSAENYDRINEAYSGEEDEIPPPRNGNIREMEPETPAPSERDELAAALDWLLFLVYSIVFAIILSCHF